MAEINETQRKKIVKVGLLETFAELVDTLYGSPMGASGQNHAPGQVPDPGDTAGTSKFLCEDGTWKEPSGGSGGGNISVMGGSGSEHASGLVPDPGAVAGTSKFLCENGTWKEPSMEGEFSELTAGNIVGEFSDTGAEFAYRPSAGAVDIESGKVDHGGHLQAIKGNTVAWNQLDLNNDAYVDLGLPSGTLWAKCNLDVSQPTGFATSPESDGSYFSWGNLEGHTADDGYDFGTSNDGPYAQTDGAALTGDIAADGGHDASRESNKAVWRMPSQSNFQELYNNCTSEWTTINGVNGRLFTSNINGNSIFIPAAGVRDGTSLSRHNNYGSYWTSTNIAATHSNATVFDSDNFYVNGPSYRFHGFSIRPVITPDIAVGKYSHKYYVKNNNIFDLTLIYGAGNEPTTVDQFEEDYMKWFGKPLSYEAYDKGSLRDVKMTGIKTVGFNQWDEEWESGRIKVADGLNADDPSKIRSKNYIPALSNTVYYVKSIDEDIIVLAYDKNHKFIERWNDVNNYYSSKNFIFTTPNDCSYLRFYKNNATTYNHDICINLHHSGDKDGQYEPYWESQLNVPITTLTGKLNGEGASVVIFPDGMKKAGSVYDEILKVGNVTKAIKRVGSVDLGTMDWNKQTAFEVTQFHTTVLDKMPGRNKISCAKYLCSTRNVVWVEENKTIIDNFSNSQEPYQVLVQDSDYNSSTKTEFKTAMSGVMLYYELEEPKEYILDDFELPVQYDVDDWGTEEILLGTDGVAPVLDLKYGINAGDTIKNLPHNYVSAVGEQNFTEAQKARARKNVGITIMGASGSNHSSGLVPDPGATAGTSKYLREDGTWAEPTGGGASNGAYLGDSNGTAFQAEFDPLTDTVWNKAQVLTSALKEQVKINLGLQDIPGNATQSTAGLMSASDKIKLDNIRNITISSSEPTSLDGQNGDIWLVYDAS